MGAEATFGLEIYSSNEIFYQAERALSICRLQTADIPFWPTTRMWSLLWCLELPGSSLRRTRVKRAREPQISLRSEL